jgi:opacity protein-like surface antigen
MTRHVGVIVGAALTLALVTAAPARAQRFEASVSGGYTFSEGVELSEVRLVNGNLFEDLDITSGGSWGFTVGYFVTPNVEIEFLYGRQFSSLEAGGEFAVDTKIADMSVDNYHGLFTYNYGESDARMRPFVFGGLGATHYSPGDVTLDFVPSGVQGSLDTATKFSTTWGGGVKFYPSPNVGVKVTGKWTPTYIKSDAGGLWCDPFYPTCWVIADVDYSNQFEFSGGVTFRF